MSTATEVSAAEVGGTEVRVPDIGSFSASARPRSPIFFHVFRRIPTTFSSS